MSRSSRTFDWGFPRWRSYGHEQETMRVRQCDREGCDKPGTCPAPKSAWTKDKWHFCPDHAAEYNKNWDYFAGLSDDEAKARAAEEARTSRGYQQSAQWSWAKDGEDGLSLAERDAFRALELESDATQDEIKSAYRRLAKTHHPDANPGNPESVQRFHAIQAAYDVLQRRIYKG